MAEISKDLQQKYDNFYSDKTEEWRKLGAKGKVENILNVTQGKAYNKIIDIGAGDGSILSLLSEKQFGKELYAAEISASAIEQMKKKSIARLQKVVQFDGYTLPFGDKEFDLAICSHVIEHVEFPRTLLREMKRISKQQVLEIPIDYSRTVDKKYSHFAAYGHINIFTPALFRFLIISEGFRILKDRNALYSRTVVKFQYKGKLMKIFQMFVKRILWFLIPSLMRNKPNTYTVLAGE